MKLTPLDIRQQTFRRKARGLDPKEVEAFLDLVADEVERLSREHQSLRDDVQRKEAEIVEHREREKTLKQTMLTATKLTEDLKTNAKKEAELVIAEAETQAERIVQSAHNRLLRIREDIEGLKRQRVQFETGLRSLIDAHGKLLDALSDADEGGDMVPLVKRRPRGDTTPSSSLDTPKAVANGSEPVAEAELLTPRGGDR